MLQKKFENLTYRLYLTGFLPNIMIQTVDPIILQNFEISILGLDLFSEYEYSTSFVNYIHKNKIKKTPNFKLLDRIPSHLEIYTYSSCDTWKVYYTIFTQNSVNYLDYYLDDANFCFLSNNLEYRFKTINYTQTLDFGITSRVNLKKPLKIKNTFFMNGHASLFWTFRQARIFLWSTYNKGTIRSHRFFKFFKKIFPENKINKFLVNYTYLLYQFNYQIFHLLFKKSITLELLNLYNPLNKNLYQIPPQFSENFLFLDQFQITYMRFNKFYYKNLKNKYDDNITLSNKFINRFIYTTLKLRVSLTSKIQYDAYTGFIYYRPNLPQNVFYFKFFQLSQQLKLYNLRYKI